MPLAKTWRDPLRYNEARRNSHEFFYVSSIPARVLPYRPYRIEPTVQDIKYKPFDLTYRAWSMISGVRLDETRGLELSSAEREDLKQFLAAPLDEGDLNRLRAYLAQILPGKNSQAERIEGILKSFKRHRYKMGYSDDMNPDRLVDFLLANRTGDCSEFAHSAALLGRLAGIPSRVVQGYLASKETQTPAHKRGVRVMMKQLPVLAGFNPDELYLITTGQHHAWVQYYLPQFGWTDFEATVYAIPPEPQFDPNNADVLIPIIEPEKNQDARQYQIPYKLIGKIALYAFIGLILSLYALRYGREAYLAFLSSRPDEKGARALARLLALKLAADGRPIQSPALTLLEYSQRENSVRQFAILHNRYLYRLQASAAEKSEIYEKLQGEFNSIIHGQARRGFLAAVRRLISLKPLAFIL
jgi:transglutaminase-like putative cysteine protease